MVITKSNKPRNHEGKWFVPQIGIELPGVLIIDKSNYSQTLKLYSKVDFLGVPISNEEFQPKDYPTICGKCRIDEMITLHDCVVSSFNPIGDEIYEIVFEPTFSFFGGITFNHNATKITRLICTFPYCSSWFDTNRLFFGSWYSTDDFIEKMKPALNQEELTDEIKINDEFSILIERKYLQEALTLNKNVKAEVKHYVHFRSSTCKSLGEFKKLAYIFMQLIKLSTGKLLSVNYITAITKKDYLNNFSKKAINVNGDVIISITNYNSLQKRKIIKSDNINQNNMLFYGGISNVEKLKQTIINWYNTYDKFSSVYNIFLDTLEWFQNTDAYLSHVMFNNRFLNLIQALESYHKFSFPDKSGEYKDEVITKAKELIQNIEGKNKKWLIRRIKPLNTTLVERLSYIYKVKFKIISAELFQKEKEINLFIEEIRKIRNDLSHGEKFSKDADEISEYYYKTLILLLCCILSNLGFSQVEIKKALFSSIKYNKMIGYIKSNMKQKGQIEN